MTRTVPLGVTLGAPSLVAVATQPILPGKKSCTCLGMLTIGDLLSSLSVHPKLPTTRQREISVLKSRLAGSVQLPALGHNRSPLRFSMVESEEHCRSALREEAPVGSFSRTGYRRFKCSTQSSRRPKAQPRRKAAGARGTDAGLRGSENQW